ncbi:MAG TPA: FAD-dependent oxidoreductase [Verrucomicrobiae bacterium]|nr:FAD-dependent oxidoreductase [Verrucomicrobiae bacterium]
MTILIVGAGQAGGECASQLRKLGYAGPVTLLGDEPHPPYKRPPLSKAYLAGAVTAESLHVLPAASLAKFDIGFRGNARVTRIDRAARHVELATGERLAYDKLLLATGGRARELNLPGARRANVLALRTIADVDAIKARLAPGKRVCIIGGGFIGLEVAAVCVKLGAKVTVLEGLPRVLARVTAPPVSAFFERIHREAGVDLRIGAQVAALEGEPEVTAVALADGARVDTDLVIVGVGIVPNVELAQDAGLAIDNGIVVDEFTRTSDENICAAGDCTNHPSEFLGRRLRLESVQNAMEQGRAAASTLLGKPEPYQMVPWFWSDQYDVKLQMVGISAGHDQLILRGDPATTRAFAAFYLRAGKLIAADVVSRPADFAFAKKLVAARARIDPALLADEAVALKSLA